MECALREVQNKDLLALSEQTVRRDTRRARVRGIGEAAR
jgi:hypothetical protein